MSSLHGNSARRPDLKVPRDQHLEKGNAHDTVREVGKGKGEEDEGGRKRDIKLRVERVGEGRGRERGRKAVLLMEPLSGLAALGDLQLKSPRSLRNPHP